MRLNAGLFLIEHKGVIHEKCCKSAALAFQGAVILTIAGLLSKVLSAVYRVPFQNIVGDTGFIFISRSIPFLALRSCLAPLVFL